MARVVHFEITADDPKRAVRFYEQALGWKIEPYGGEMSYWLAATGPDDAPGIHGAIMPRSKPGENTVVTVGWGISRRRSKPFARPAVLSMEAST